MPARGPQVACNLNGLGGPGQGPRGLGYQPHGAGRPAAGTSCVPGPDRYTQIMNGSGKNREPPNRSESLYFFPDQKVTADEARQLLRQGTSEQRAWVISHLLRYAQWDDIWTYV